MFLKKIYIKDLSKDFKDSEACLEIYRLDYMDAMKTSGKSFPRPGLIVVPGGGYYFTSDREAEPIALRFLCEGFNTFVLRYTCGQKYPVPHKELAFFIDYLSSRREEYDLTDDNLSLIGFSAGGHLVGSYSSTYKEVGTLLNLDISNLKPSAIILGYPVITMDVNTHMGTKNTITNNEAPLLHKMSIEKNIDSDYPPTYVFTTKEDSLVPYVNTTLLIEQLEKHNIPHKAHIFEHSEHGGSLFTRSVCYLTEEVDYVKLQNRVWLEEASDFVFSILKK